MADLDATYLAADTAAAKISIIFVYYYLGPLPKSLHNQIRSLWLVLPSPVLEVRHLGKGHPYCALVTPMPLLCRLGGRSLFDEATLVEP